MKYEKQSDWETNSISWMQLINRAKKEVDSEYFLKEIPKLRKVGYNAYDAGKFLGLLN